MRPACNFSDCCRRRRAWRDLSRRIKRREARIAIGLQKAAEVGEMGSGMFAAAVGAIEIGSCRRCRATERPVVADINP
jgi:hypothetical protein